MSDSFGRRQLDRAAATVGASSAATHASSDGGVLVRARRLHTNARPAAANATAARRILPVCSYLGSWQFPGSVDFGV